MSPETLVPESAWVQAHTGLILVGFASLVSAVSSAFLYLIQSHQLKSKHPGKIFLKLPSLEMLDKIHFRSLAMGLVFFSIGLLSGVFSTGNRDEIKEIFMDPRVILSLFACLMYWLIFTLRLSQFKRGQKIAMSTILVFIFLLVTFISGQNGVSGFHKSL